MSRGVGCGGNAPAVRADPPPPPRPHHLPDLLGQGTVDEPLAAFLAAAIRARKNILVAGGTSIGKTTLLRALAAEIPARVQLVTIEDTYELGLDQDPRRHPDAVAPLMSLGGVLVLVPLASDGLHLPRSSGRLRDLGVTPAIRRGSIYL